jgi:FKBP-type peptidyl-prolyl cis-trans isomerase FkpA
MDATRTLLAAALLPLLAQPACRSPAEERAAEEREEREKERQRREKAEREFRENAEKGPLGPADRDGLYALGALLGSRVAPYALGPEQLALVERGFADAARGRKLELSDPDLEEWGPKVEAMLQRRASPALAAEKEKGRRAVEAEAALPEAERLPSGVVVRTLRAGTGLAPGPGDRVRLRYEGRVAGGEVFDRSPSAEVPVGQVIPCLGQGLQKVRVGGNARLVCPAPTAYGDQGRPPQIPGGATLVFEVELLAIIGK